jgi:glyoxylase-like metal-dependent hydrolase (beta-lactamase superfamily II)
MPNRHRLPIVMLACLTVTGCSSPTPSTWGLSQRAVVAMGGAREVMGINTITMSAGTGTRNQLGQLSSRGAADPQGTLASVITTLDLAGGRAAYEYDITLASGFGQHRVEVLTEHEGTPVSYSTNDNGRMAATPGGLFSWGPQNSPVTELRRNPVTIILEAASSASGSNLVEETEFNGNTRLHGLFTTTWGEEIGLYFDPESELLVGFTALDTEPMLGDTEATYILGDYQAVGDILLPHRVTVMKAGEAFSDVRYTELAINELDRATIFEIPEDLLDQASRAIEEEYYAPLTWNEVANGVFHVVAYSHHSMVVEFPSFVAIVEAPYTETQSLALAALVEERIPDKPIRYAAITHPHWDHTGGVRGIAAIGATLLFAEGHEVQMRPIVDAPHTNPPDRLEQARADGTAGSVEIFREVWSIADGPQSLELHEVEGSPHADPYVLAYVPAARLLFQSDLFNPGTGSAGTPASAHLLGAIRELNLDVQTLVGGHGTVGPFSELVAANRNN